MKKAIIVGHTGQDGCFLSELLQKKKYELTGISSSAVSDNKYGIENIDIAQSHDVEGLVEKIIPDEIYFMAAVHQSSSDPQIEDGVLFQRSLNVNVSALINFLESIRKVSIKTKLFYAASSHIFGSPEKSPQNELTGFSPDCIYGITKSAGTYACRFYRDNYNVFAAVGILYNHESEKRESKYVSQKIVETAVAIKYGIKSELILGDLESKIDWGYAPDYVNCIYLVMQLVKPDDFIISSGEIHSIKDFVSGVFSYLNIDYKMYVKINQSLITKKRKQNLYGDNRKVKKLTGWSPATDFHNLIKKLVDEELKKYARK